MDDTDATDPFSYEPFTRHAFYTEVNRALIHRAVDRLKPGPTGRVLLVDLGCGTGAATELLVEGLTKRGLGAEIVAIEPSADALARAAERLAGAGPDIRFAQGDASDLSRLVADADLVLLCNAIHLVQDKADLIQRVAEVLAPGGMFVFNSTFFAGAYAPNTERFYRLWTICALRWLRREHPDVRLSRDGKTVAMQWVAPEDYDELLEQTGLETVDRRLDDAMMTLESFRDIGRYRLFIEGALPGAPLAAGAAALEHGAAEAFAELGLADVPRRWLQVIAQRKG